MSLLHEDRCSWLQGARQSARFQRQVAARLKKGICALRENLSDVPPDTVLEAVAWLAPAPHAGGADTPSAGRGGTERQLPWEFTPVLRNYEQPE